MDEKMGVLGLIALPLDKWKRNHFNSNRRLCPGTFDSEGGAQISAGTVEASFDKSERDFLPKSFAPRCARNPAPLFAVRRAGTFHPRPKRRIAQRDQPAQSLVCLTGHLDS